MLFLVVFSSVAYADLFDLIFDVDDKLETLESIKRTWQNAVNELFAPIRRAFQAVEILITDNIVTRTSLSRYQVPHNPSEGDAGGYIVSVYQGDISDVALIKTHLLGAWLHIANAKDERNAAELAREMFWRTGDSSYYWEYMRHAWAMYAEIKFANEEAVMSIQATHASIDEALRQLDRMGADHPFYTGTGSAYYREAYSDLSNLRGYTETGNFSELEDSFPEVRTIHMYDSPDTGTYYVPFNRMVGYSTGTELKAALSLLWKLKKGAIAMESEFVSLDDNVTQYQELTAKVIEELESQKVELVREEQLSVISVQTDGTFTSEPAESSPYQSYLRIKNAMNFLPRNVDFGRKMSTSKVEDYLANAIISHQKTLSGLREIHFLAQDTLENLYSMEKTAESQSKSLKETLEQSEHSPLSAELFGESIIYYNEAGDSNTSGERIYHLSKAIESFMNCQLILENPEEYLHSSTSEARQSLDVLRNIINRAERDSIPVAGERIALETMETQYSQVLKSELSTLHYAGTMRSITRDSEELVGKVISKARSSYADTITLERQRALEMLELDQDGSYSTKFQSYEQYFQDGVLDVESALGSLKDMLELYSEMRRKLKIAASEFIKYSTEALFNSPVRCDTPVGTTFLVNLYNPYNMEFSEHSELCISDLEPAVIPVPGAHYRDGCLYITLSSFPAMHSTTLEFQAQTIPMECEPANHEILEVTDEFLLSKASMRITAKADVESAVVTMDSPSLDVYLDGIPVMQTNGTVVIASLRQGEHILESVTEDESPLRISFGELLIQSSGTVQTISIPVTVTADGRFENVRVGIPLPSMPLPDTVKVAGAKFEALVHNRALISLSEVPKTFYITYEAENLDSEASEAYSRLLARYGEIPDSHRAEFQERMQAVKQSLESGDYRFVLDESTRLMAEMGSLLLELPDSYLREAEKQKYESQYESLRHLSTEVEPYIDAARQLYALGDYENAMQQYQKALNILQPLALEAEQERLAAESEMAILRTEISSELSILGRFTDIRDFQTRVSEATTAQELESIGEEIHQQATRILSGLRNTDYSIQELDGALYAFGRAVDTQTEVDTEIPLIYTQDDYGYYATKAEALKGSIPAIPDTDDPLELLATMEMPATSKFNTLIREIQSRTETLRTRALQEIATAESLANPEALNYLEKTAMQEYENGYYTRVLIYSAFIRDALESGSAAPQTGNLSFQFGGMTYAIIPLGVIAAILAYRKLNSKKKNQNSAPRRVMGGI